MSFVCRALLSAILIGAWAPYDCPDSLAKYGAWLCTGLFVLMVWRPEGNENIPESDFTRKKFEDGPRRRRKNTKVSL